MHVLPVGNYVVKASMTGLYLEQTDPFEWPSKVYGNVSRNTDRILSTFSQRSGTTGVLLSGEKGSGKTLLAKSISMQAARRDEIPTIIINSNFTGDVFNTFLQGIDQPCIIMFDEFEKTYANNEQESILTLLDGVFSSKKLFLFTCNDKYKIDINMKNRPGRIFYFIEYEGLTDDFIVEYCKDNLKDTTHVDYIAKLPAIFHKFNFDMLKALVEEMNRYNETPQQALSLLNIRPEYTVRLNYDVKYYVDDIEEKVAQDTWSGNPAFNTIEVYELQDNDEDKDERYETVLFHPQDLKSIQKDTHVFAKENKRLVLTRAKEKPVNYYDYL